MNMTLMFIFRNLLTVDFNSANPVCIKRSHSLLIVCTWQPVTSLVEYGITLLKIWFSYNIAQKGDTLKHEDLWCVKLDYTFGKAIKPLYADQITFILCNHKQYLKYIWLQYRISQQIWNWQKKSYKIEIQI